MPSLHKPVLLLFLPAGLFAAAFHLGKPSNRFTRAWHGTTQWRTSWLSHELIGIPVTMGLLFEHWFFFAQARHPPYRHYQTV